MHNTGWRAMKSRAGGIVIDQGVHDADLMHYFLGDVESVYAQTDIFTRSRRREGISPGLAPFYDHRVEDAFTGQEVVEIDLEDSAFAVIRFVSGAIGHYAISDASHGHAAGVDTVHGSLGTMIMPRSRSGRGPELRLDGREGPVSGNALLEMVPDWELDDITAAFFDGKQRMSAYQMPFNEVDSKLIAIEYQEFADAIETGRRPEVDGEAGMRALGLIYAMLESGLASKPVRMADLLGGTVRDYQREIDEAAEI